jgi:hypothetical protein
MKHDEKKHDEKKHDETKKGGVSAQQEGNLGLCFAVP